MADRITKELKFSWKQLNAEDCCPSVRFGHGLVQAEGKVFVFGGAANMDDDSVTYHNDMYILNVAEGDKKWEVVKQYGDIPTAREGHVFCSSDTELYLFGGVASGGDLPLQELYIFNIDTSTWTKKSTKGNPPTASSIKGLYRAGKIITFGGIQEKHAINSVFSLDLSTLIWEEVKTTGKSPQGRCDQGMVIVSDRLFITGGSSGEASQLDDWHSLSLVTWEWSECNIAGDGPAPRDYPTMCNLGDQYILLFGGFNNVHGEDTTFGDLFCMDLANEDGYCFRRLSFAGEEAPCDRYNHRSLVYDKKMYVFGGSSLDEDLNDLWVLSPEFEIVDISITTFPDISYQTDSQYPMSMATIAPQPINREIDMSELEDLKSTCINQIGKIFATLTEKYKNLEITQRENEATRVALETEKKEHRELYEKQQQELQQMFDQHRRETEDWLTKNRLYIDAQKRRNEEMKVQLEEESAELKKAQQNISDKGKKLDAIMKQVQGLAD